MSREYVAIVGSRDYPRLAEVRSAVVALPRDVVVVTGDARGVDGAAFEAAGALGMERYALAPCWELGRKAGPLRNEAIVRLADRVIAFWDGQSRGTASTIQLAQQYGKPVEIVGVTPGATAARRGR